MTNSPELPQLLRYENESVINRFCAEHPGYSIEQARQIFQDLLGWMWLSVKRAKLGLKTHMIAELTLLDKMWHIFILHTKNYTEFCRGYFNEYLHHDIEPLGHEYVVSTTELSNFLSDCYDLLGENWIKRNFNIHS